MGLQNTNFFNQKNQIENLIDRLQAFLPLADWSFVLVPAPTAGPGTDRGRGRDRRMGVEAKQGKKMKGGDQGGMEQKCFVVSSNSFANGRRRL